MKIKTSALEGKQLDYAVGLALYPRSRISGDRFRIRAVVEGEEETIASVFMSDRHSITTEWKPSTDWGQGGPLIDRFCPLFTLCKGMVRAEVLQGHALGETYLIAACRAMVAAKLGEQVEIPDELVEALP